MNWKIFWDSVKTPARQVLLIVYALLVNKGFVLATTLLGFEFTPEQKIQILEYGTPLVWAILSGIDNLIHDLEKAKLVKLQNTGILGVKGLTGF